MHCLCFAAASAVCFEDHVAGLDATETGNELSQHKFEFIGLVILCGFDISFGRVKAHSDCSL